MSKWRPEAPKPGWMHSSSRHQGTPGAAWSLFSQDEPQVTALLPTAPKQPDPAPNLFFTYTAEGEVRGLGAAHATHPALPQPLPKPGKHRVPPSTPLGMSPGPITDAGVREAAGETPRARCLPSPADRERGLHRVRAAWGHQAPVPIPLPACSEVAAGVLRSPTGAESLHPCSQ